MKVDRRKVLYRDKKRAGERREDKEQIMYEAY